jgi:hypothetical protein
MKSETETHISNMMKNDAVQKNITFNQDFINTLSQLKHFQLVDQTQG